MIGVDWVTILSKNVNFWDRVNIRCVFQMNDYNQNLNSCNFD